MKKIVLVIILFCGNSSFSKEKTEHRHHHAHVHGSAKMSIAFDGLKGRIEFQSAADSILGFEYVPKNKKDKETLEVIKTLFKDNFYQMVSFDSESECKYSTDVIEQRMESKSSKHSDFIANYNVECKKSILNTKVVFNFSKFDKLKDIDVTVLVDQFQKSFEISNKEKSVDLK